MNKYKLTEVYKNMHPYGKKLVDYLYKHKNNSDYDMDIDYIDPELLYFQWDYWLDEMDISLSRLKHNKELAKLNKQLNKYKSAKKKKEIMDDIKVTKAVFKQYQLINICMYYNFERSSSRKYMTTYELLFNLFIYGIVKLSETMVIELYNSNVFHKFELYETNNPNQLKLWEN